MDADEVVFEPLPDRGKPGPKSVWRELLKARPGEWARLKFRVTSTYALRQRYPDFQFERRTVDGEARMYGRYVGGEKPTAVTNWMGDD